MGLGVLGVTPGLSATAGSVELVGLVLSVLLVEPVVMVVQAVCLLVGAGLPVLAEPAQRAHLG